MPSPCQILDMGVENGVSQMADALLTEEMAAGAIGPGTRVEVQSRFDGRWARGFEVAAWMADGYAIRRLSDGHELPRRFSVDEVRLERKRAGLWWA